MFLCLKTLIGYKVTATDGDVGTVEDFYFDDETFEIRYIVIKTLEWFGKKVLLPPQAMLEPIWQYNRIPVNLTTDAIKNGPAIDSVKPVSRKKEKELFNFYNWIPYWSLNTPGHLWYPPTDVILKNKILAAIDEKESDNCDKHLRSFNEVKGYGIIAKDEKCGHLDDFIISSENAILTYLVVDTKDWLPSKNVLLSNEWVKSFDWNEEKIHVDVEKSQIENSPEFDPKEPVNRKYEEIFFDYYGRPKYWD